MAERVEVSAPAKVNLYLRVLGRRDDGFHDIETLFQAIDLSDDLAVEVAERGVTLDIEGPDLGPVEENLAYRAARSFLEVSASERGVRLELTKHVPAGAGLGGGSSDAAAVLKCLRELIGGVEPGALHTIAVDLGSDVPFFLGNSALARGSGRGEVLESCPALPVAHVAVVTPPVHVSTAWAYAELAAAREGHEAVYSLGPPVHSWADVRKAAVNDFEVVVEAAHPEVARGLDHLRRRGAEPALLSGSGGASFGVFMDEGRTVRVADEVSAVTGWSCRAVATLAAMPQPQRI